VLKTENFSTDEHFMKNSVIFATHVVG